MLIETLLTKLVEKSLQRAGVYSWLFNPSNVKKRTYIWENIAAASPNSTEHYSRLKRGEYLVFGNITPEDGIYSRSYYDTPFWKTHWTDRDPKDFWEIARGWQWSAAYFEAKLFGEENLVVDIIHEWFKRNPYPNGLGWAVGLEVAIRAINLYIIACDKEDTGFGPLLDQHTDFLKKTLWISRHAIRNNHYLGELVALAILTKKKTRKVEKEIKRQFLEDGVNIEQSIQYHRFSLEFLIIAQELLSIHSESLLKALFFLDAIEKPDGSFPNIGDNDEGCVCPIITDPFFEGRNRIRAGAWQFEEGGFFIYKTEESYFLVKFGPHRWHAHADLFHIELSVDRNDILVDSGTYRYNSCIKERKYYRSTQAHNTLEWNGKDQTKQWRTFRWKTPAKVIQWETDHTDCELRFQGVLQGFDFSRVKHTRVINLKRDFSVLCVRDKIAGAETGVAKVYWHFDPGISLVRDPGKILLLKNEIMVGKIIIHSEEPSDIEIKETLYSKAYGHQLNKKTLVITAQKPDQNSIKIETTFLKS
ncbi:MAG TPA: heparinase II/III-family protein [Thermotogota bacterium]|nr:heparinase II/III-family protein [Thermotogota bacterium]HOS23892.1 heparinase II/III-family protein [Thermotogota bacterium]HPD36468.1 heparinase II/III-family protein [Thermotogota bacterium]HQI99672.1 heparinase II/III-family protein [Thermotogota bacterium]